MGSSSPKQNERRCRSKSIANRLKFLSISKPTENNDIFAMKQSQTSPISSPWSSPLSSSSDEIPYNFQNASPPKKQKKQKQVSLYKLPAGKHQICSTLKPSQSGDTTAMPTNFGFASCIYSELQSVLKIKNTKS